MISDSEYQAYQRVKSNSSTSVESLQVGGNVDGTIVVGSENVVYNYKVHTEHGTVVNLTKPAPVKLRTMYGKPLRPPASFVGRERVLTKISRYMNQNQPVFVYGPTGIGKSTLLAQATHLEAARSKPHGVVYMEGMDEEGNALGKGDVIQRLFDALFESTPPLKVNFSSARSYLSNTQPLVVLDHHSLDPSAFDNIAQLFPEGALLVSGVDSLVGDPFAPIRLLPLERSESIQLLLAKAGIAGDESTNLLVDQACDLLADVPLAISLVTTLLRNEKVTLAFLVDQLRLIEPSSTDPVRAGIERAYAMYYRISTDDERRMLGMVAGIPGRSADASWLEKESRDAKTRRSLESLGMLVAINSRVYVPDGLRQVVRSKVDNLGQIHESLLYHLLDQLETHSLDFGYVKEELGNILGLLRWASAEGRWSDVIALGKAVDPYLTLNGLWDCWELVLRQVMDASEKMQDLGVRSWVLHQLGSRAIGVGDRKHAFTWLLRAFTIRLSQGDAIGAYYTEHNLLLLIAPGGKDDGFWKHFPKNYGVMAATFVTMAAIIFALFQPSLRLNIQANPASYNPVGQIIKYTYDVDNSGLVPLEGPIDVSTLDQAQLTCPNLEQIGNGDNFLDPGEMYACTSFYTITDADVKNRSVTNTATAIAKGSEVQATQSITLPYLDGYAMLSIQASPKTYSAPGDKIRLAYFIENVSAVRLPGPFSLKSENLAIDCENVLQFGKSDPIEAGKQLICTTTYTITDKDIRAGYRTFFASAILGDFITSQESVTINYVPSDLALKISVQPEAYQDVGQEIRYNYEISNQGIGYLSGSIIVTDDLIRDICPELRRKDILYPGETVTCTAAYSIQQTDIDRRSVTNTSTVTMGNAQTQQSNTIYYRQLPPVFFISAMPETYSHVDEEITYTYLITNPGSLPLSGTVSVQDGNFQVDCSEANQNAALDSGQSVTCTRKYKITDEDLRNKSVTNTAWTSIGDLISGLQSHTIYYTPPSNLYLTKSAKPMTYQAADEKVTYFYFVTTEGPSSLPGPVVVVDNKTQPVCKDLKEVGDQDSMLDPGEQVICTAIYITSDADVTNGSVTNFATASAGGQTSKPSSATIYAETVDLDQSGNPDPYDHADQTINYVYTITGRSIRPLHGPVSVTDDKLTAIDCPALNEIGNRNDTLEQGETVTCKADYSVTQNDLENLSITNTAVARIENARSVAKTITISANPKPGVELSNTPKPKEYDTVGEKITYTYTIRNNGNMIVSAPFKITDDHVGNNQPFDCDTTIQRLVPDDSLTCENSGQYVITQSDLHFGGSSVTTKASASATYRGQIISSPDVTTTIACPNPPQGWVPYTVENGEILKKIITWFRGLSIQKVQQANCMGLLDTKKGDTIYLPGRPPPRAVLSGYASDTDGIALDNTPIRLLNLDTGMIYQVRTDGNGYYIFTGVEAGRYRISNVTINLERGMNIKQNLTLVATITP